MPACSLMDGEAECTLSCGICKGKHLNYYLKNRNLMFLIIQLAN